MKLSQILKEKGDYEILSFEETGRAMRVIIPVLGITKSIKIKALESPYIPLYKECWYWYYFGGNQDEKVKVKKVLEELDKLKINYRKFEEGRGFSIDVPVETFLSVFKDSDDPEDWKRLQKEKERKSERARVAREKRSERKEQLRKESREFAENHYTKNNYKWDSEENKKYYDQLREEIYSL